MLLAKQIAEFLSFSISKIISHPGTYLLKLHIYDVILGGHNQTCPGMPKEAIKT